MTEYYRKSDVMWTLYEAADQAEKCGAHAVEATVLLMVKLLQKLPVTKGEDKGGEQDGRHHLQTGGRKENR